MRPSEFGPVGHLRRSVARLGGSGRGWALAAIAVGWFLVLGLRFVVPALLPVITTEFPVSNTAAGAAITLLWLAYAAMQFPAGALVDRVGERSLLAASAGFSALAMAVYAVSPTFAVFLVATTGFGLASGLFGPARGTMLSRLYDERDGAAFGTVLAMGSIGSGLLPPVLVLAAAWLGWRGALGITTPAFLACAAALWWAVPSPSAVSDARTDGGTPSLRARAGAVARGMRTRRVALATLGTTLYMFVLQGLTAFFTTYLVTAKGLTEGTAGALFGLLFLSAAVSQATGGTLADRYGHGRVLAAVSFVGVVPLLALPVADGTLPLAVVAVLLGTRLSIAPVANAYIVARLPPGVRGTAWGLLRTAFFSIGAFGSTVVGTMADRGLFAEAFLLLAALTAVTGLVYLTLPVRGETPPA